MFNDIGALEVIALAVLAVIVFGPEKLPKVIQDVSGFIRKVRAFSESAKEDIRSELGPEFKDFEFEDLNPRTFVRKQLMDNDDLGLNEIRSSFDLRKEMNEVADAVNGRESESVADVSATTPLSPNGSAAIGSSANGSSTIPDLLKKREKPVQPERPPFDADAT
ncbi:sec-independent translocase [Streptomyces sp. NPDC056835]|uniref:sec-independent translocase n=1 Tax=Streptomyces sp. NPDC056835 TaxID=3345956 RepID=UPI0036A0B257